ncbi:uncharacterized protein LOC132316520 [Cornus florida]|uniref:uncharacterized protein LOC132316520 n=1 Tax=Cornus florida TaxID=4283 RepID=UPI002897A3AC|nr:uncharacterized protein LOC132316520 [Cornus florida]
MSAAGRGRGRPARDRGQGGANQGGAGRGMGQIDEALQMPNPNAEQVPMTTYIRDIRKLGAIKFVRAADPLKAKKWIDDMEKYFEMMDCTEVQKRMIAAFFLWGEARQWWQTVTRTTVDIAAMTWEEFKTQFYEKHFPRSVRKKKGIEFMELEQSNTMTVSDYEIKFTELSRFAPHIVANKEHKIRKFEWGLISHVKRLVVGYRCDTYAKVVECAMAIEENNNNIFQKKKGVTVTKERKRKGYFLRSSRK